MTKNWEQALIAVVERELAQLEYLIAALQKSEGETEKTDVHAQVDRLGGLTDLGHPDGLPVSDTTKAKLQQVNETALGLVHSMLTKS